MGESTYCELREWADEKMKSTRASLANVVSQEVVMVCGSYASREASAGSKVDFFVVSDSDTDALKEAKEILVGQVREILIDRDVRQQADDDAFGEPTTYHEVVRPIGGNGDGNARITRRMLPLLEGDWLVNSEGFRKLRRAILEKLGKKDREDKTFRDLEDERHLFTRELLKLSENRFDSTYPIRRAVVH